MVFSKKIFLPILIFSGVCFAAETPPAVDGVRALEKVRDLLAISPRDSGTENARKAAEWLADQCKGLGLLPTVHVWEEKTVAGAVTFRNVSAVIPGKHAKRLLIGSHYDTKKLAGVPDFKGANDSGSSTGLLLETMRVIQESGQIPPLTLEFVFFDGEECVHTYSPTDGLHGSRKYARTIREEKRIDDYKAMILLDMIGDRDLTVTLSPDTPAAMLERLLAAARQQNADKYFRMAPHTILDDHVPFAEIGIPAIDIIDFQYGPGNTYWHTRQDTIDKLSSQSLETIGNVVMRMIWNYP